MQKLSMRIPAALTGRPVTRAAASAPPLTRRLSPSPACPSTSVSQHFSTTANARAKNQIFDPVRNSASFQTYLSLSTSSNRPLLTLWTASWCSTCRTVEPRVRDAIAAGVGEEEGGVNYAIVEFDAPDAKDIVATYLTAIRSVPTLLAFDARRGEPVMSTRVADARSLGDRDFLETWIRNEAARHSGGGSGGGGSGPGSAGFGGLFGSWKK